MNRRILKYPIPAKECEVAMPVGAQFIHLDFDPSGVLCMWCLVDPTEPIQIASIRSFVTGEHFDDRGLAYLGTAQNVEFVWHVFQAVG